MGGVKIRAVSTFNAKGLGLYGKRMMRSFAEHWPESVSLRVYSEGWAAKFPRVQCLDLGFACPWLGTFKARHKDRAFQNYRHDAVRFAHKVAAITAAAKGDADYVIWIDGDVVTHAPISFSDVEQWLPAGDEWIAWLDRAKPYPECGFYVLNCRHPMHNIMIAEFEDMYRDGLLFGLAEWHDSFVLDHIVQRGRTQYGINAKSLSGAGFQTHHPMVNGPLGAFMDHLKGGRKEEGRSRPGDLKTSRSEAYWQ